MSVPSAPGRFLRAALYYARHGWPVFPLRPRSKVPATEHGFYDGTKDPAVITPTWKNGPNSNIGIPTGTASGLVVLDVDPRHGGDDTLAELEHANGEIPDTPRVQTGGGGLHVYLLHPGGVVGNRAAIWPGVDLRGDGGYVVAPPSVHESGREYLFEAGYWPHDLPLADPPGWLLEKLLQPGDNGAAHPPEEWRRLAREGVPEGERNDRCTRLVGHLLRHDVDALVTLELVLAWNRSRCQPPLPDGEVVAIVESIAGRERRRRAERRGGM